MRRQLLSLTTLLLIFANGFATAPAFAEWTYLVPGDGDQNVHRAFAYAEEGDDLLEFACNAKRRDLFYSTAQTVSKSELGKLNAGQPTVLIRLEGVGLVALDAEDAYQKDGRLIFVTGVKPRFINDIGKLQHSFAAGMRADGKIVQQGVFPTDGLQAAMKGLATGCGF